MEPIAPARRPRHATRLRRLLRLLPALALLLLTGACVDLEQLLRVRADGGGDLLFNVRFDPKILQEAIDGGEAVSIEQMLAEMRENAQADAQSQASEMGEGVRFVGVEELPGERPGLQLRFEFDDVAALRLSPFGPLGGQAGGAAASDAGKPISFQFERGSGSATLRVALFTEEELAELEKELTTAPAPSPPAGEQGPFDQMAQAMTEMMKQMFEGLRVAFVIEPVGEVESTNSSYRDGNRLTLFRFDFGALLADEEKLARLAGQQEEPSLAALRRLVGEVEGMQMELLPEMRVQWR
jgi:hypothetical protein